MISKIVAVFLYRLNIPQEEVEKFTDQIERRDFSMLFDSFEAYDVQETRRISKAEGEELKLIKLVCKMKEKSYTASQIADMFDEEEATIQRICNAAADFAPDYDVEGIYEKLRMQ